jgi:hypothetical protein
MPTDNLDNFKDQGPAVGSAVAPSKIGEAALAFEVLEALPRRGGWTLHLFAPVLSRALPKYITHVTLKKVLPVSLSLIKIDSPMFISWMYLMNAFEMKQLLTKDHNDLCSGRTQGPFIALWRPASLSNFWARSHLSTVAPSSVVRASASALNLSPSASK